MQYNIIYLSVLQRKFLFLSSRIFTNPNKNYKAYIFVNIRLNYYLSIKIVNFYNTFMTSIKNKYVIRIKLFFCNITSRFFLESQFSRSITYSLKKKNKKLIYEYK